MENGSAKGGSNVCPVHILMHLLCGRKDRAQALHRRGFLSKYDHLLLCCDLLQVISVL